MTDMQSLPLTAEALRTLALESGADDAGAVSIERAELDDQRDDLLGFYPWAKTLLSFVCRMNREPIRALPRSVANNEFHHTGHDVDEVTRSVVRKLESMGVRASSPAMGFPMEMDRFPGKLWTVSHKPVAVAAGLGQLGIHRNLIHPKFGNFVLLGTVVIDAVVDEQDGAIDYNPCLECKLCVAACPVGAIGPDGYFDFSACYTHNYREFMGGFSDFVETVVESRDRNDYRSRMRDTETTSVWQSLSFGANYKAAYCLAVCPAGDDVIGPWLESRSGHLDDVVRPLQRKRELTYVIPGSDAEAHVTRRFPHKETRPVRGTLIPTTLDGFLGGMQFTFQRHQSAGVDATYHFTFTGREQAEVTIIIRNKTLEVERGHHGNPTLRVWADTATWLGFLAREKGLMRALITGRIRVKGNPKWLARFGRCFPS